MLALDTLLAMMSALKSDTTIDQTSSSLVPSSPDDTSISVSQSAGLIFSSTKQEMVSVDTLLNGVANSEPDLLQADEEDNSTVSPGTASELLKARQLKKVLILQ